MTESLSKHRPLSWPTILFIIATTIGAGLWPLYAYNYGVSAGEVVLAIVYLVAAGMSITVGYHRLISHRAFKCQAWLKAVLLVAGSAAWQGSALEWASDHIRHHGYIDTERDPYNIRQGIWHAHIGWLFRKHGDRERVPSFLSGDRLVVWQHRYYIPLAVLTSFVLPYLIAGIGGLMLAGVVRIVVGHHSTWLINSWAHVGRRRPYDPSVSAADNWFLALLTFGEGFHNYHHAFPRDYRNGVTPFAFDPSKWLVWVLSLASVTYDLERIAAVTRWRHSVRTAVEYKAGLEARFSRLRMTRQALEKQLERSRIRLERALERSVEVDPFSADHLRELRARLATRLDGQRERLSRRARRRLEKAGELVDTLEVYCALRERLCRCEAELSAHAV